MEVNLANERTTGCFGQGHLQLLAGMLPLFSAVLIYFQIPVFCALG